MLGLNSLETAKQPGMDITCFKRESWHCCTQLSCACTNRDMDENAKRLCNLCGHLQRRQIPDIENSRKTAEKGAEWVTVKQPKKQLEKQPKHPKNSCFDCFSVVSAVFPAVFRLFYRDPLGTLFGCFSAVFNVGHRWRQRLQKWLTHPSEAATPKCTIK